MAKQPCQRRRTAAALSFHHEDKPAFRPFLIKIIDLDVDTQPVTPISLDELPIPAPLISDQLLAELTDAV